MTTREAELELEIARLRDALHYSLGAWHYDGISDEHGSIFKEANDRCDAQPSTTALQELITKVERLTIERCAAACDLIDGGWHGDDSDVWTCMRSIRNLPTGQIKLEEL